jgi:hypothetical protein
VLLPVLEPVPVLVLVLVLVPVLVPLPVVDLPDLEYGHSKEVVTP